MTADAGSGPTRSTEEKVQEDLYRLEAYRSQLAALVQQHQMLTSSRQDHDRAARTLEGIEEGAPGREYLLPIGAETYVRGTAEARTPVLVGIGSGIVVELPREAVVERLKERAERIAKATVEIEGQIEALEARIQLINRRLEASGDGSGGASGPSDSPDVGSD